MSAITIRLDRRIVLAIGLMSGTSHDGVSAAVVELDERSRPPARLIAFHTFPYPARFRKELLAASADEKIGAAAISTLNFALGHEFGRAAIEIAQRARVALSDVCVHRIARPYVFSPAATPRARADRSPPRCNSASPPSSPRLPEFPSSPTSARWTSRSAARALRSPRSPISGCSPIATRGRVVQNIGGIGNATYIPPRARARRRRPDRVRYRPG